MWIGRQFLLILDSDTLVCVSITIRECCVHDDDKAWFCSETALITCSENDNYTVKVAFVVAKNHVTHDIWLPPRDCQVMSLPCSLDRGGRYSSRLSDMIENDRAKTRRTRRKDNSTDNYYGTTVDEEGPNFPFSHFRFRCQCCILCIAAPYQITPGPTFCSPFPEPRLQKSSADGFLRLSHMYGRTLTFRDSLFPPLHQMRF